MNFRTLIKDTMLDAMTEFSATVEQKLAALFGDGGQVSQKAAKGRPKGKANKSSRGRATPEQMQKLTERVMHAVSETEFMKKGEIMKKAKIGDADETRVRNVLSNLTQQKVLVMMGERGSAKYKMKPEKKSTKKKASKKPAKKEGQEATA